jgi:uncharacterized protein
MGLKATNVTRGVVMATRVVKAASFIERSRGLLGRDSLPSDEALWIAPCASIHMFFMRFTIDVAFLDKDYRVLWCKTMKPWRMSPWVAGAKGVLEMPEGTLHRTGTRVGDHLAFEEN